MMAIIVLQNSVTVEEKAEVLEETINAKDLINVIVLVVSIFL